MALVFPDIHLNGTSATALSRDYEAAYDALGVAYDLLKKTAPNGRDYYTLEAGSFQAASEQHQARLRRIDGIRLELEQLIDHVIKEPT